MRIEARARPVGSGTGLAAGGGGGRIHDLHWGYFGPVTALGATSRPFGSPHLTCILQPEGQPQPPQLQQHRGQSSLFKFQGTMNAADSTLDLCMAHGCREASGLHCCIEGGGMCSLRRRELEWNHFAVFQVASYYLPGTAARNQRETTLSNGFIEPR